MAIDLIDKAVETSEVYGVWYEPSGRFNHLFDPRGGTCSALYLSVSVLADTATAADAHSTAVSLMPPGEIPATLRRSSARCARGRGDRARLKTRSKDCVRCDGDDIAPRISQQARLQIIVTWILDAKRRRMDDNGVENCGHYTARLKTRSVALRCVSNADATLRTRMREFAEIRIRPPSTPTTPSAISSRRRGAASMIASGLTL